MNTNDDFETAARAEAVRAWTTPQFDGGNVIEMLGQHMAEWARTYLAEQEPTDGEVEAAAEALWKRHSDPLERKVYPFSVAPSRMRFIVDARAALTAARAVGRDAR